jgi:hypothetical protein
MLFFTVKLMVNGTIVFQELRPAESAADALQAAIIEAGLMNADPRGLTVVVKKSPQPVAIA